MSLIRFTCLPTCAINGCTRRAKLVCTQALVELRVLQHLRDNDPGDEQNVIHIKVGCETGFHEP
jgi:hypothetical protein